MSGRLMCVCTDHETHLEAHHCTIGGLAKNLGIFMRNTYEVAHTLNPAITPHIYLNERFDVMQDILTHLRCEESVIRELETKRKIVINNATPHITTQIPFIPVVLPFFSDTQLQRKFAINPQELMSFGRLLSFARTDKNLHFLYGVEMGKTHSDISSLLTLGECLNLCLFEEGTYEFPFMYKKQDKPKPPFIIKRLHQYGPQDKFIKWYPTCARRA